MVKRRVAKLMLSIIVLVGVVCTGRGCNTVEGVGEDVEAAGDSIQDAADGD